MMVWTDETAKLKVHLWERLDKIHRVRGEVACDRLAFHPGGGNNTVSRLVLQNPQWHGMPLKLSQRIDALSLLIFNLSLFCLKLVPFSVLSTKYFLYCQFWCYEICQI